MLANSVTVRLAWLVRDFLNTDLYTDDDLRALWMQWADVGLVNWSDLREEVREVFLSEDPEERRWATVRFVRRWQSSEQKIKGRVQFDDNARPALDAPRFASIGDALAVVLAELAGRDPPAEIYRCRCAVCEQFICRDLHHPGKKQRFCSRRCQRAPKRLRRTNHQ
jgi:hypothetical protein